VPRKVRQLIKNLKDAGFTVMPRAGKGSHRKLVHPRYAGAVTISGSDGDDAKHYQEKALKKALEDIKK
jgi:predicted RNA binding protein YcfA (HicA-like mRNA interferase family)